MFFKPNKNQRIVRTSEESWGEVAASAIALALTGYILTILVFLL